MNISENRINELIELFNSSDNASNFKQENFNGRPFLKRDLIEAKVAVDRWGVVVTDWVFHSSKEKEIKLLFSEDENEIQKSLLRIINSFSNEEYKIPFYIYGANVHFVDYIESDAAIGFAFDEKNLALMFNNSDKISNSIIVFKVQ